MLTTVSIFSGLENLGQYSHDVWYVYMLCAYDVQCRLRLCVYVSTFSKRVPLHAVDTVFYRLFQFMR